MPEKLIDFAKGYLKKQYNCHSIILYGSFNTGDYTEESDIDLICFCDYPKKENDTSMIKNKRLDAWIYGTERMKDYSEFMRIRGGKIILDERNLCTDLLSAIDKQFLNGPRKLTLHERDFLRDWLRKMLQRSKKGDVEGNFRYHWLLTDILSIYFDIKCIWYLGPKKSLQWLYKNDRKAYYLFASAFTINADIIEVENLVEYIINL